MMCSNALYALHQESNIKLNYAQNYTSILQNCKYCIFCNLHLSSVSILNIIPLCQNIKNMGTKFNFIFLNEKDFFCSL